MAQIKIPTVDNFLNYLPLDIGGYGIAVINLLGNAFASILQLRNTISMNLKEFHGESDSCKNSSFYSYNELMSANTVLSTFISFYLLTGIASKDATKILPFLLYVGTYTLTSFIHMMSVNENHVAFGFLLVAFHGYSLLIIYSIFAKILEGKSDEQEPEAEKLVQVDVDKPKNNGKIEIKKSEKSDKNDVKEKIIEKKTESKIEVKKPEKKIEKEKIVKKIDVKKVESKPVTKNDKKSVKKPEISKKDIKKAGLKFPKLKKLFHDKVEGIADSKLKKEETKENEEKEEEEEEAIEVVEENPPEDDEQDQEEEDNEDENDEEENEEFETLEIVEESDLKDNNVEEVNKK